MSLDYDIRKLIPMDGQLQYNHAGAAHYAARERDDLLLLTQRLPPRPQPARDSSRPYNTTSRPRKQYISSAQAQSQSLLEPRPITTRRNYE